jgi:acid phosphatase family membrane protein YuiD
MFRELISNRVLLSGLTGWFLAQLLKVPIHYLRTGTWHYGLWFSAGGMPSSHSALVVATSLSIGFLHGFDTPVFALSVALAMIVIYDAAGVRREAGIHAQRINHIIQELFKGHPISEFTLKEVLGHTPRQVIAGSILGTVIAILYWVIP